jgi:hypothetical protein
MQDTPLTCIANVRLALMEKEEMTR